MRGVLQRLKCFLFGHKVVYKVFAGGYYDEYNSLTFQNYKMPLVKYERSEFCLRCGRGAVSSRTTDNIDTEV